MPKSKAKSKVPAAKKQKLEPVPPPPEHSLLHSLPSRDWDKRAWALWEKEEEEHFTRINESDDYSFPEYMEQLEAAHQWASPAQIQVRVRIAGHDDSVHAVSRGDDVTVRGLIDKACSAGRMERDAWYWNAVHREASSDDAASHDLLGDLDCQVFARMWSPGCDIAWERSGLYSRSIVATRKPSIAVYAPPQSAPKFDLLESPPPEGCAPAARWQAWSRANSCGDVHFWRQRNDAVRWRCPANVPVLLEGISHSVSLAVACDVPLTGALAAFCASHAPPPPPPAGSHASDASRSSPAPPELLLRAVEASEFIDAQTKTTRDFWSGPCNLPIKLRVVYRDEARSRAEKQARDGPRPEGFMAFSGGGYLLDDIEAPWLLSRDKGVELYNAVAQEAMGVYRGTRHDDYDDADRGDPTDPVGAWWLMLKRLRSWVARRVRRTRTHSTAARRAVLPPTHALSGALGTDSYPACCRGCGRIGKPPKAGWEASSIGVALDQFVAFLLLTVKEDAWRRDARGKIMGWDPACRAESIRLMKQIDAAYASLIVAARRLVQREPGVELKGTAEGVPDMPEGAFVKEEPAVAAAAAPRRRRSSVPAAAASLAEERDGGEATAAEATAAAGATLSLGRMLGQALRLCTKLRDEYSGYSEAGHSHGGYVAFHKSIGALQSNTTASVGAPQAGEPPGLPDTTRCQRHEHCVSGYRHPARCKICPPPATPAGASGASASADDGAAAAPTHTPTTGATQGGKQRAQLPTQAALSSAADPKLETRRLPPLASVDCTVQLQLSVSCEEDSTLGEGAADAVRADGARPHARRDLVLSGNASAFDLVKAILCAYGLDDQSKPFVAKNTLDSLHLDGVQRQVLFQDIEATYAYVPEADASGEASVLGGQRSEVVWRGPIVGLHAAPESEEFLKRQAATAAALKLVKLAQLLDKPLASTPDRPSSAGVRDTISIELVLPQRCAFVSRAFGGAMTVAEKRYYAFAVRCEAIGAKSDMASDFQAMLPRCVGGAGGCHGGNAVDWDYGDDVEPQPPSRGRLAIDELNVRLGGGRHIAGLCFPSSSGMPERDYMRIAGWMRRPLFELQRGSKADGPTRLKAVSVKTLEA